MPILAGGQSAPAPEEPEIIITGPTEAYKEDIGTITATWIDPLGNEWPLSNISEDIGWFTTDGPAGWGATPIELVVDALPRGGEQVRFIRSKPRRLQWPIYIFGDTHQQFVDRLRSITRAFTMTTQRQVPGWLRVARPGGARQIACFYEQGLELESGEAHTFAKPVVQLYCPDGYWSDVVPADPVRRAFAAGGAEPSNFFSPFMTIASSKVIVGGDSQTEAQLILNPGDVEAWPTWTITGPITQLTATNYTINSQFTLSYSLAAGQQILITTQRPTVRGPGNLNLSRYIDWFNPAGTELWPLVDGINQIAFQADGAGVGAAIELRFTPRYELA